SLEVIRDFAEHSRAEWVASGLRKGYMYMADLLTDPRWYRGHGTFGEDPEFVSEAIGAIVRGFQGEQGLRTDGVALTTKHFPGGDRGGHRLGHALLRGPLAAEIRDTAGTGDRVRAARLRLQHRDPGPAALDGARGLHQLRLRSAVEDGLGRRGGEHRRAGRA